MRTSSAAPFDRKPGFVLLDLDNTLYEYAPSDAAALDAVRRKTAQYLRLDGGRFDAELARARQQVKARLAGTASSHSRLLYFQALVENVLGGPDVKLAVDLEQTYWRAFLLRASLFPGAREFIGQLRFLRIPIGLVTDLNTRIQMRKLIYFDLDHSFDAIVTSEEAGAEKPDRAIFELVREKLGADRDDHFWMIGDEADKDIRGAMDALNATGFQKIHAGVSRSADAAVQFASFSELTAGLSRFARPDRP
jgi:putative hydrolase of the HAD superfamily